mgnify:CR=1 FL=1
MTGSDTNTDAGADAARLRRSEFFCDLGMLSEPGDLGLHDETFLAAVQTAHLSQPFSTSPPPLHDVLETFSDPKTFVGKSLALRQLILDPGIGAAERKDRLISAAAGAMFAATMGYTPIVQSQDVAASGIDERGEQAMQDHEAEYARFCSQILCILKPMADSAITQGKVDGFTIDAVVRAIESTVQSMPVQNLGLA